MSSYQAVLEEHEGLREMAERLRAASASTDPSARASVVSTLQVLTRQLAAHFALEEEGGFFAEIMAHRPDLDFRVTRVREQHDAIQDAFAALLSEARGGADLARVAAGIDRALEDLDLHEHAETELLQESLLTDIGPAD